jgi:hypothetical protein
MSLATVGVGEAAQLLNVSEAAVYRLLRTGNLHRASASEFPESAIRVGLLDVQGLRERLCVVAGPIAIQLTEPDAEPSDEEIIGALRKELEARDAQIQRLIETHTHLSSTIERLQEEMYELARSVVSQRAAAPAQIEAVHMEPQPEPEPPRGLLRRLFSRQ